MAGVTGVTDVINENDKVPFMIRDSGQKITGYVMSNDVYRCLRDESKYNDKYSQKITIYYGGCESKFAWSAIKSAYNVAWYIEKHLPEYLV